MNLPQEDFWPHFLARFFGPENTMHFVFAGQQQSTKITATSFSPSPQKHKTSFFSSQYTCATVCLLPQKKIKLHFLSQKLWQKKLVKNLAKHLAIWRKSTGERCLQLLGDLEGLEILSLFTSKEKQKTPNKKSEDKKHIFLLFSLVFFVFTLKVLSCIRWGF